MLGVTAAQVSCSLLHRTPLWTAGQARQAHPDSPLVPELPAPLLSLLAFGFHA
jgi:hypothetical protein